MKIALYGCGSNCKYYIENEYFDLEDISFFIDRDESICSFYGISVYRLEDLCQETIDSIDALIVTNSDFETNKEILNDLRISKWPENKIYFILNERHTFNKEIIHEQDNSFLSNNFMDVWNVAAEENAKICCRSNLYDSIDNNKLVGGIDTRFSDEYIEDYFRYRTFEYLAEELIDRYPYEGYCAELGVFRGVFASLINAKFGKRKLYLFDTFKGFSEQEYEKEVLSGDCEKSFNKMMKQTSIEIVMKKMRYPESCIIRKGLFPDSLRSEDDDLRFIFVSLDVDLEESTLNGMRYFYPRMLEGGCIFVHDYHHIFYSGVKRAIQRYENELGHILRRVPLSDCSGTMVIIK